MTPKNLIPTANLRWNIDSMELEQQFMNPLNERLFDWRPVQTYHPPKAVPTRTVDSLQRELLAICRGGKFAESWRKVNEVYEWPNLRNEMSKKSTVEELREQIRAIDPNAATYPGWEGVR